MVLPVGQTDEVQQLIKIEKTEDGPSYSELCDVLFVPLAEGCSRLSGTDRPRGCIEVGIEGMIRTRFNDFRTLAQTLTRTAAVLVIASCASTQSPDRAATSPAAPSATVSTAPDATGIVTYDGYQAALARSGDTVASVAQRIGLSASELGAYNGLSPTHPLRRGDEMVLPPRSGGYSAGAPAAVPLDTGAAGGATDADAAGPAASDGVGWSPDLAAAAIERASGFGDQGDLAVPPSAEEPLLPNPPLSRERLLSRAEVEAHFGISKRFLEVAALTGDGPPMCRIGKRMIRYRVGDLFSSE